jgi:hypothetical protein
MRPHLLMLEGAGEREGKRKATLHVQTCALHAAVANRLASLEQVQNDVQTTKLS